MFISTLKRKPAAGVQTTISIDGLEDAIQDTKIPKNLVGFQYIILFLKRKYLKHIFYLHKKHLSQKIFRKMLEEEQQLTNLFFSSMCSCFFSMKKTTWSTRSTFCGMEPPKLQQRPSSLVSKRQGIGFNKKPMAEDQRRMQSEGCLFKYLFNILSWCMVNL